MPNIHNTAPIDPRSPEYDRLLRCLQGNILKGHGRDFTANIFLQFHVEGPELKEVLRSLTRQFVTSAYEQIGQREQHQLMSTQPRDNRPADPLFGNLFLTRNTYRKLDPTVALSDWFPDPDEGNQRAPRVSKFRTGMFQARAELGDELTSSNAVEPLEIAYVNGTIDALLLLANNSEPLVLGAAERLMAELSSLGRASVVAFEVGRVRRDDSCRGIEHFGYVDGISQPLFFTTDFEKLRQKDTIDRWDPFAPLSLVLFRDPGTGDEDAFGSYYVFRKLEQNVLKFRNAEIALAMKLELAGEDASRAGAMIIGRFRDGTPLVSSGVERPTLAGTNDFRYDGLLSTLDPDPSGIGDRLGLKCPFQSHIRKVNPRQSQDATSSTLAEIAKLEREHRDHRIVRRGITYGVRTEAELPETGVGLLFGCFQSSIIRQYAFIQRNWANTSIFRVPGAGAGEPTGLDPIIGQPRSRPKRDHRWRAEYGGAFEPEPEKLDDIFLSRSHPITKSVGDVVTFRGGEFFFAPSLPFLLGK